MSKVREVIARSPCEQLWRSAASDTDYRGDCTTIYSSAVPSFLQVVRVTRRYPGFERSMPELYLPCDWPKDRDRKERMRSAQRYVNPSWQRFLTEVDAAIGGKSFIKGCVCRRE